MKPADPDITLLALDRLPPADVRELEARLAENPELAAQLRDTEDTLTAVWQAAAPLRSAPPGSFAVIHAKLHPVRSRPALPLAFAAVGWAAALALLAIVIRQNTRAPDSAHQVPPRQEIPAPLQVSPGLETRPQVPAAAAAPPELLQKILHLQASLSAARQRNLSPEIRELRAPGDQGHSRREDRQRALLDLITAVLADSMARRTEAPASLVIENGWLESAFAGIPENGVIRHRSFPETDFADFGLLRSPDGEYYDPSARVIWTIAEDGGGYLGRIAPPDLDLSRFEAGPVPATDQPTPTLPAEPSPSGYLVQGGPDEGATLVIGNLPTDGTAPQLVASNDGGVTTLPLTPNGVWPGPDGTGLATYGLGNTAMTNHPVLGVGNLTVLQRNADGTFTVILTESP